MPENAARGCSLSARRYGFADIEQPDPRPPCDQPVAP
jgi:hypothetical protein